MNVDCEILKLLFKIETYFNLNCDFREKKDMADLGKIVFTKNDVRQKYSDHKNDFHSNG